VSVMWESSQADRGGYVLLSIPGGTFRMGSPEGEAGRAAQEGPVHSVTVPTFQLGRYPVTNREYQSFLESNPDVAPPGFWGDEEFTRPHQPVVGVTFDDATRYCAWAGLRLPSEAEWEYACRAGTATRYHHGDAESDLQRSAWYSHVAERRLHDVGEKAPNAFGLYDMHGNVWEWCEDDWHDDYVRAPADGRAWLDDPRSDDRILRGGSWFGNHADYVRSATRRSGYSALAEFNLGFRCAR
jgi:formylglycine-generating enzyme required for sulfatase activity